MREDGDRQGEGPPVQTGKRIPESGDRARISRDMEGIFGSAIGRPPVNGGGAADGIETLVVPRPKRARPRATGAPVLLAFGALIGGGLAWMALSSPNPTPTHSYHVAQLPSERPADPVAVPSVAPSSAVAQDEPNPLPAPVSIVPAFASRPAAAPAAPAAVALAKRAMVTRATYHPPRDRAPRGSRGRASADRGEPCAAMRGLWRARCMRPQVVAADRRLRDAYDDAVRAGVDRDMLVAYRNRWNRIRGDAVSDPSYVTAAFDQMARRLDAARADTDRAEF